MTNQIPSLAGRVKQLREAAGLSQQALAQAAGLSISVVTQLEQGAKADPRISTVAALARALRTTVDSLVSPPAAADAPAADPPADPAPAPKRKAAGDGKTSGKKGRKKT